MADKPFAIIGVNSDRNLEQVRAVSAQKAISWRSFWNGEKGTGGPISKKWQITSWPSTFLLDKDGVIRYKNLRGPALDKAIEELMAEMGEEVELVGIDHEAEDAAAMAAAKAPAEPEEAEPEGEGEATLQETPQSKEPTEEAATKAPAAKETEATEEGTDAPAQEPAAEEPAVEAPAAEEPAAEEPAAEEPAAAAAN